MIEDSADSVSGTIRQLIADGANPLIAEDLIAEGSLMAALEVEGVRESAQYLTRVLRDNQYHRVSGRPMLGGVRQFLWVRAGAFDGVEPEELHEIARKRLEGEGDEFV
jgi:hypothetical protein